MATLSFLSFPFLFLLLSSTAAHLRVDQGFPARSNASSDGAAGRRWLWKGARVFLVHIRVAVVLVSLGFMPWSGDMSLGCKPLELSSSVWWWPPPSSSLSPWWREAGGAGSGRIPLNKLVPVLWQVEVVRALFFSGCRGGSRERCAGSKRSMPCCCFVEPDLCGWHWLCWSLCCREGFSGSPCFYGKIHGRGGDDAFGDIVDLWQLLWIILCGHYGGQWFISSNALLICLAEGRPSFFLPTNATGEAAHPSSRVHGMRPWRLRQTKWFRPRRRRSWFCEEDVLDPIAIYICVLGSFS